jgi:hypothetical protein
MQTIQVTFSLPASLNKRLHTSVKKRGLSTFVTKALEKALDEEHEALKACYAAANQDADRKEVVEDWASLDSEEWHE